MAHFAKQRHLINENTFSEQFVHLHLVGVFLGTQLVQFANTQAMQNPSKDNMGKKDPY